MPPNRIEPMAQAARGKRGAEHIAWVRHLRNYINGKPESDIIEEMQTITDKGIFNVLIEVGLNNRLMEALTVKWNTMP